MAVRIAQPRSPKVPEIRKGDTVVVLAGKDAGKRGTVEQVIRRQAAPSSARSVFRRGSSAGGVSVVVEGLNIAKRHTKPRQSASTTTVSPLRISGTFGLRGCGARTAITAPPARARRSSCSCGRATRARQDQKCACHAGCPGY
jgi:ribosomal protein L24